MKSDYCYRSGNVVCYMYIESENCIVDGSCLDVLIYVFYL